MSPKDVSNFYRTQQQAADAIGVSKQVISKWKKKKRIPLEYQIEFEIKSNGQLRADVPLAIRGVAA